MQCRQEKEVLLSELSAVKQDFEDWKIHEHVVKMSLQGLVDKFENRCASLQARVVQLEDPKKASPKEATPSNWEEERKAIVQHNRVVKAQMQERIDRMTALLVEERNARQNAYEANVKVMKRMEQIAMSDKNPQGAALMLDQYISELHQEMEALRDTVILLRNDNAELVNERNHLKGQRQQMQRTHMKNMKEQESIFLAETKSKNLEIERLHAQVRDLAGDKNKLKSAAGSGTTSGEWKAVLEKDLENLNRRLEESSRWRAMSDDTILTLRMQKDNSSTDLSMQLEEAQVLIKDLENRCVLMSEDLDRERIRVTQLESRMYDLTLSTKSLNVFMDNDIKSKTEAIKWHEQDQARIDELEGKLHVLNGNMNNVRANLDTARISTHTLEEQHRKAVRELEQEIELLRRRCSEGGSQNVVVKKVGNASALIELQSAMESASERSLYFESREAMLQQEKKYLQNQLDLLTEEKMSLEKAQELLLRENANLKKDQESSGLRKYERAEDKDRRLAESARKIDILEAKLKEAEADNEKKHRDLNTLRDRLMLLDRMKHNADQSLERERANGSNVAILSDMLKDCEHANRNLESQLKVANSELQESRNSLGMSTLELREANAALLKSENCANELKNENSRLQLDLFKFSKDAREQGEEAHKVHRRNKDLERENEELQKNLNHLVLEMTPHTGSTEASELARLGKHAANIEAELKFLKKDYYEKVMALEDAQLALEEAESARKFANNKLKELEATTKDLAHTFRECKDKLEDELTKGSKQGEQLIEKESDLRRKNEALTDAHRKDLGEIERLRADLRKMGFDLEVTSQQNEQTAQRFAEALDKNLTLQATVVKLEDELRGLTEDLEDQGLALKEALRIQKELEKSIEEDKIGSVGSTNLAWEKLEKVAAEKAVAEKEIVALKLELEETLKILEKVQLNAREGERMWSGTCRELEGRLEKLEAQRRALQDAVEEHKNGKREDDDTIDAIATELQNCRKHARDMELQKESIALEMSDAIALSTRLTEEVEEAKHQCDLRDIKIDQLTFQLDERESEFMKVHASFKSMGEVAQNQQAQITLLQAEREKDLERVRELADEELMEANEQISELKRELQRLHQHVQMSLSTKSNDQEQALMTARMAQEEYEELKFNTEDKIKNAMKQLEVEQLAKLQLEYCVAELEVQLKKDKADYLADLNEEKARHQKELAHHQKEMSKEQDMHHQALDMLQVYQIKQKEMISAHRRTIYNVVDQRTRRMLTRFFDKWALLKHAYNLMDASTCIWFRRWSDREVMRSFCSWANYTMRRQHLRFVADDMRKRQGRRIRSFFFRSWIFKIENEKYKANGVEKMWHRNQHQVLYVCLRKWNQHAGILTRSKALLRSDIQRGEYFLKSIAFHGLANNAYVENDIRSAEEAKCNYEHLTARAQKIVDNYAVVITTAANRMVRSKQRRLCMATWKHWVSNYKNSKRLDIVAAAFMSKITFRKKQRHMQHWLSVAKSATRLWLEGENAVQKLHWKWRHRGLACFKAHWTKRKVERRLLGHVAFSREHKRKLDGLDAFAALLIKRSIKTHVDTVEGDASRKLDRMEHECHMKVEKANRQIAQIQRELGAKAEDSERRASSAEKDLKRTRQMLSDAQAQIKMLDGSLGDNQREMMDQLTTLAHERQFADDRYAETAEFLRQKEVELERVETLLAETVANSKRHTEMYEKQQGEIHDLTLEVKDLTGQAKAREMEFKTEKVDMEIMFDKQLAKSKSDHMELEEEIARLKDRNALLQEGLKSSGESTDNASGKLINQIDDLKRRCTALQDELTRTKESATGKGTVALRLNKVAHACAFNAYQHKGLYSKARAFHGWRHLKYHRKCAPYLVRYHRGCGKRDKMGLETAWHSWFNDHQSKKNARARAELAYKSRGADLLEICWSAFQGLLHDRMIRNDYAQAWRSTFSEMEAEKLGSMQLTSEMENLRQTLAEEREARSVAEYQLEQVDMLNIKQACSIDA